MPSSLALAPESAPAPPPPHPDLPPAPIAPWLHTAALIALLVGGATITRHNAQHASTQAPRALRYISSIVLEWVLLGLALAGIRQRAAFLRTAFCNRATSLAQNLGLGVATYCIGVMVAALIGLALYFTPLAQHRNTEVILAMLPHSPFEFVLWFLVSLSAGICEELVFRGYFQQQFTAWIGRPIAAIVLVALLFGSVHLYEGAGAVLPLAALALVYGFVVRYLNGDLRAVIVAHTLQDFFVAFLALARPLLERAKHMH